jgi:hypothetical protein
MFRVITLTVAILCFAMLNVFLLIVTAQSVGMLKDVMPIVNALSVLAPSGVNPGANIIKKFTAVSYDFSL